MELSDQIETAGGMQFIFKRDRYDKVFLDILIIAHSRVDTGGYSKILEMSAALAKAGHRVTYACTSRRGKFFIKESNSSCVRIIEFPDLLYGRLRQGIDLWNTLQRILFLTKENFDVIHAIDCRPAVIFPSLWMQKFKNVPLVISWWDWFGRGGTAMARSGKLFDETFGHIETFFEEYFRKYADRATVVSSLLKARLEALGYPQEKIEIHRVGCNISKGSNVDKAVMRKQLNLPEAETILCYAGVLFKSDMDLLIDSLRILKKEYSLPTTILVGKHYLEEKISNELSIQITGWLPDFQDVCKYLHASDYAIVPMITSIANKARWPSKVSDYWAAGLPVIATPISDYPSLFPEYNLGYLSLSDRPRDFADAIHKALVEDASKYRTNSLAALAFARNELDWDRLAEKLVNLYRLAIASARDGQSKLRKRDIMPFS